MPLVEGVSRARYTGAANADMARTGALVYLMGGGAGEARKLVWVDQDGTEEALAAPPRYYHVPRVSQDGTRAVVQVQEENNDLWVFDLARGAMTRLTFDPTIDDMPLWSPDGERIVFHSLRDGGRLFSKAADGTGEPVSLTATPVDQVPMAWSHDGTVLVTVRRGDNADIGIVPMNDGTDVEWLLQTEFDERRPAISPDGQWIAYDSDESGELEVYVQPFPSVSEGRWQVSTGGGQGPLWSRDGEELFYFTDQQMMRVSVQLAPGFSAGTPEMLFEARFIGGGGDHRMYDLAPDGRFLTVMEGIESSGSWQIHVVLNWHQELQARVPTGR